MDLQPLFKYQGDRIGIIEGSQMPRHLICDAHEWINVIPTVLIYFLANPLPRERAWFESAGKEDPFEFDSSLVT
jgi:hypothetical protein